MCRNGYVENNRALRDAVERAVAVLRSVEKSVVAPGVGVRDRALRELGQLLVFAARDEWGAAAAMATSVRETQGGRTRYLMWALNRGQAIVLAVPLLAISGKVPLPWLLADFPPLGWWLVLVLAIGPRCIPPLRAAALQSLRALTSSVTGPHETAR